MNPIKRFLSFFALMISFATPVWSADETEEEPPYDLGLIVVTGTRFERFLADTPVTTEVMTSRDIKRLGFQTLSQVFAEWPGIATRETQANAFRTNLQGLYGNRVLILIDGQPIVGRTREDINLAQMSLENVERIEVVKGAQSALYGSEAVGGVINIITRKVPERETYSLRTQMEENIGSVLGLTAGTATPSARFLITFSGRSSSGFDLNPSDPFTEGPDLRNTQGTVKLSFPTANHGTFTVYYEGLKENTLRNAAVQLTGGGPVDVQSTNSERHTFDARQVWNWKNGGSTEIFAREINYRRRFDSSFLRSTSYTYDTLRRFEVLHHQPISQKHWASFGAVLYDNTIKSTRLQNGQGSVKAREVYMQDSITMSQTVEWVLGARFTDPSSGHSHFAPKTNMLWRLKSKVTFRASVADGFRNPDVTELFQDFVVPAGPTSLRILGNPDLEPEKGVSYQLGFELGPYSGHLIRISGYLNDVKDLIQFRFDPTRSTQRQSVFVYRNIAEAEIKGLEIAWLFPLSREVQVSLGAQFKTTEDASGHQLEFNPHSQGQVKIYWTHGRWNANLRGSYVGKQYYAPDTLGPRTPDGYVSAYWQWNARVAYSLNPASELYVGVNNLMDKTVPPLGPLTPRSLYAGAAVSY
ncbi:MAG: TonB-dependent receptor plug domain-containing protein [bacterium JZ-2024 1]